ncbi:MAG TPA: acyltransferase [Prevotella sp.]
MLSRTQCNILRGLAIIGIFLHNYCHWLNPVVKENEYTYVQHNVDQLMHVLFRPDALLPMHILSFFGHYGVPLFLFLSAYGLVRKYEAAPLLPQKEGAPASRDLAVDGKLVKQKPFLSSLGGVGETVHFIFSHFRKLFRMMIVGFVLFTIVDAITPSPFRYKVVHVVAQLGMFNNLLPQPDRMIWPGPYWFFGLMLQLYIVYRFFMYRRHWGVTVGLMLVCWLMQAFCEPEGETLNRIRYNFMGGMLPFGMGYLYARFGKELSTQQYMLVLLASLAGIAACSTHFQAWLFVPLFVCTAGVAAVKLLPESTRTASWLNGMGVLSSALFVCHPVTRKIFIPISRGGEFYSGLLLYIISSIALAWLVHELMEHLAHRSRQ